MNKKGFTLVELLGVLVLVAIILTVVVTPIVGQINSKKGEIDEATKMVLFSTATSYLDNYQTLYPKGDGNVYYISLERMMNAGELSREYIDGENLTKETTIKVTVEDGGYQYSIIQNIDNEIVSGEPVYSSLGKKTKELLESSASVEYLEGTYFQGNVTNNYVYFSGFLWRIVAINEDGSIKLVTDEVVSTTKYGKANGNFEKSFMYNWLNDYFYTKLSNFDLIREAVFCDTSTNKVDSDDLCENSINPLYIKVGLLGLSEFNNSKDAEGNSYLKNGTKFSLTNSYHDDNNLVYVVGTDGNIVKENINNLHYVRPVINIDASTIITAGSGTSSSPFILNKNIDSVVASDERTIKTINMTAGEYISFDNKIYRVIEKDKKELRMILDNFLSNTYNYSSGGYARLANDNYIGKELNTSIFNGYSANAKKFMIRTYIYQGDYLNSSTNIYYKNSSMSNTNMVTGMNVSLPRVSEILSAPIKGNDSKSFWTMSMSSASYVYKINNTSTESVHTNSNYYVRPVITVDSGLIVSSGNGTKASPYVLKIS